MRIPALMRTVRSSLADYADRELVVVDEVTEILYCDLPSPQRLGLAFVKN